MTQNKIDVKTLFEKGRILLKTSGNDSFAFDAACLFEHFFGITRADIIANPDKQVEDNGYIDACKKRAAGYPLQYILGSWQFMGLDFKVTPDVLIPRADTETLVEYVLKNYSGRIRILDMCCGSGCIGLSLKHFLHDADVTLCDISDGAIETTKQNAKRLNLDVTVCKTDLLKGGDTYFERDSFDIIISNPPYITSDDMETLDREVKHEPFIALCGGKDGTDFYKALIDKWEYQLKIGGEMILESGYDTADSIRLLFTECGYADIRLMHDLNGIIRVISAKRGLYK